MTPPRTTYQLWIWLDRPLRTAVGRLGVCAFPRGWYAYTGSARGGPAARIRRHCRDAADKRLRWHINCFLAVPETRILYVSVSEQPECSLNAATGGQVVCPGLGASDCRAGCSSHLRYLGKGPGLPEAAPRPP